MIRDFENPGTKYRMKPFWFWNGEMTEEMIARQIMEMKEKGLGGFFICARQGLTAAYLSKKWFDLVGFACEKAKEAGLEAWIYDEYPYPSGMGGGEVMLEHPEAEHKVLKYYRYEEAGPVRKQYILPFSKVLYARAFPVAENGIVDYGQGINLADCAGNLQTYEIYQESGLTCYSKKRFFTANPQRVLEVELPKGQWEIKIYTQEKLGDFKYYGAFFDPCDKAAVRTFLDSTHERYERYLGNGLGSVAKGMFSDEVGLLSPIPWSGKLPAYFEEKNGYSLLEKLPALHDLNYPDACRIRYDLYHTVHELFVESYHKQVADWCAERGLYFATEVPSMRMTTQRYSTVTGGDTGHEKLGKPLEEVYDQCLHHYRCNPRAVSSLKRQLGRDYAMIESFHSIGWTMTIQDAKWILDRLAGSGINFYNLHAFYYTIDSITKHDAPPSQFLQNSYWEHYRLLADYAARLSAMVTGTKACTEIAVLDPVASLWTCVTQPFQGFTYSGYSESEKRLCEQLKQDWTGICKTLLFEQLEYDHLDTEILVCAEIRDGKLCIGEAEYSLVIIPPSLCIESFAAGIIRDFIDSGGNVLALGMLPHQVIDEDSNPARTWQDLLGADEVNARRYKEDCGEEPGTEEGNLQAGPKGNTAFYKTRGSVSHSAAKPWLDWCRRKSRLPVRISAGEGSKKQLVSSIRKEEDGSLVVFLANQGETEICPVIEAVGWDGGRQAEEYMLETGKTKPLPPFSGNMEVALRPYQSRLLHFKNPGQKETEKNSGDSGNPPVLEISLDQEMPVSMKGGNIFRLADFEMSLNGRDWKKAESKTFLEQCVDTKLLCGEDIAFSTDFGIPRTVGIRYPQTVRYRRTWHMEVLPERIELLMDKRTIGGSYEIRINGKELAKEMWRSHFVNDQNNMTADIRRLLQIGENRIEIQTEVKQDSDGIRDPLYLYGDFGVSLAEGREKIVPLPKKARYRSSFVEGFPFYSGTFTFENETVLSPVQYRRIQESGGAEVVLMPDTELYQCVGIEVNEKPIGVRAFAPWSWYLPKENVKEGNNHVKIRITTPLAAMLEGAYFDYGAHQTIQILSDKPET